jgi:hypothetical protein
MLISTYGMYSFALKTVFLSSKMFFIFGFRIFYYTNTYNSFITILALMFSMIFL